jgi:hypothetical protein
MLRCEPASCSGFNLLLIAAYSYIVNSDLDLAKRLCRGYRRRDAEKRHPFFYSTSIGVAPSDFYTIRSCSWCRVSKTVQTTISADTPPR